MEIQWRVSLNRPTVRLGVFLADRESVTADELRDLAATLNAIAKVVETIRRPSSSSSTLTDAKRA